MKNPLKILAASFSILFATACAHQPETLYSPAYRDIEAFSAQMSKDLQAGAEKLLGHSMYSKSELDPDTGLLHFNTELVPRDGFSAIYSSYNNYCIGRGGVFDGGRYGKNLCITADTGVPLFFVSFRKDEGFDYAGGDNFLITASEATHSKGSYKLLDIAKRAGFKTTRERETDAQWEEVRKHEARANLYQFQQNATVGTPVLCGMIINTRGTIVEVQTISHETAWVPRDSLKRPREFSDRFIELAMCADYLMRFKQ